MRVCRAGVSRQVADASNTLRHRVLLVRRQPPASPDAGLRLSPFDDLLKSLPLKPQWAGDVYRGLALLLRRSPEPPHTAIVCIDGLAAAEFEFFSIVSKLRRDLKVYVYASARSESRIAWAVELGAKGPLTQEVLEELAGSPPTPMTMKAPPQAAESVADKTKSMSPAIAQQGHTSVDHAAPFAPVGQPRIDDEDARKPARVPWLRYSDRPARVAPTFREPPPQASNQSSPTPAHTRSYEPLLTEEELRALMSDDIATIVGDDPNPRWPDDDDRARGAP